MLEFDVLHASAPAQGAPTVVLLHGRGADRKDLAGLRPHLPESWTLVLPDAPFAAAPWGYGPGRAWYRFLGRNRPEAESFEESVRALDGLVGTLDASGPLYVGGFSQGGTLSLGWALARRGGHVAGERDATGVINLSGFLADHPWAVPAPGRLDGLRLFWGHGTRDPNIPFELALEGRSALAPTGVTLVAHDYPIGHWIDGAELADLVAFVQGGAGK